MRKLSILFLGLLITISVAACAVPKNTQKTWSATGGSRADAIVEVSYEYFPNKEIPVLVQKQADDIALERCKAWGYLSAEAFGGEKTASYIEADAWQGAQTRRIVTRTYQCLGNGDAKVDDKKPRQLY